MIIHPLVSTPRSTLISDLLISDLRSPHSKILGQESERGAAHKLKLKSLLTSCRSGLDVQSSRSSLRKFPTLDIHQPWKKQDFCNLQCKWLVYRCLPKLWRDLGNSSTSCLWLDATWCCREKLPDPWKRITCSGQGSDRHFFRALTTTSNSFSWILESIKEGYKSNNFCIDLAQNGVPGAQLINNLWYIGDCLMIPRTGDVHENLFHLAHDTLGHFSADKSYANLHDAYYWPNMWTDLEKLYVPSCSDCQCNKSCTTKPPGPLHPLPVPDKCGDSMALDFVGPLPKDDSYNCILTMTNRLRSDYCLIPTRTDTTTKDVALLVFDNWYCENRLPSDFVFDQDKLFISCFWKALTKLTGVQLKMSSTYIPPPNKWLQWVY